MSSDTVESGGGLPWLLLAIVILLTAVIIVSSNVRKKRASNGPQLKFDQDDQKIFEATFQIGMTIVIFCVLGALAVLVACIGIDSNWEKVAYNFGFDMVVGGAAGAIGALTGFIFGIPRTQDSTDRAVAARAATQGLPEDVPVAKANAVLAANTNLERVSDWLTAILLGATLVQLGEIPGWLEQLAKFVSTGTPTNEKIAPFVVVYFFGLGFLGTYLITRLYLTSALSTTLALLTGADGVANTTIGIKILTDAINGDTDTISKALERFDHVAFKGSERLDPDLNAAHAKLLAKYLASGEASDVPRRKHELLNAMRNAVPDARVKGELKEALTNKSLTTKDDTLDAKLKTLVD